MKEKSTLHKLWVFCSLVGAGECMKVKTMSDEAENGKEACHE